MADRVEAMIAMSDSVEATEGDAAQRRRRELVVAWTANVLACVYCTWLGGYLWQSTIAFGQIFEGLGTQLPASTQFVLENQGWLYPVVFGGLVAVLLFKEMFVYDKRLSTMLSLCVTILAQLLSQWFMAAYYHPLFQLIKAGS